MSTVVFFSTFENKKQAANFAQKMISKKLAACINILPNIESHYIWKDKKYKSKEVLIIGKTTAEKFKKIKTQIKSLHPYEVPELVSIKISDGLKSYLNWIANK